jgi:hypothetical protein
MKGSNYGVTLSSTGAFGGYGWSEFGGYVDFTGASIDATCLSIKTNTCPVSGMIKFLAANDPQSGGWDGQAKMSDPSWTVGVTVGPEVGGVRPMAGYAWGGDVAGWIDFSQVKILVTDLCTNIDGVQNPVPPGYTKEPALPADQPGVCQKDLCTNLPGIDLVVPDGYTKKPALPADQPGVCKPIEIKACKIVGDPNYDSDPTKIEDNTLCVCPNGDYNATTEQCGTLPPKCPVPNPETNYPTMPGYNSLCPIVCKKPLVLNSANVCELPNGDQCPTTKVSNPLNQLNGQNDPKTTGIEDQSNWPAGYRLVGNKCGIPGCGVSYAKNFDNNANTTIDVCDYCKGKKAVNGQCVTCTDPNDKTECPAPPKGFIRPILQEV